MIPTGQTTLGKLLRLPLRLMPRDAVVTVRSGVNRGFKWRVGASTHGCWLGTYEADQQALIRSLVRPDMVAWDVGANAGFHTLALSRLCRQVVAFEPFAENVANLLLHREANALDFQVVQAALSDRSGLAGFWIAPNNSGGRIREDCPYRVPTMTADDAIAAGLPAPDFVKMDVEGGELPVLRGARNLIAQRRTSWLISLHIPEREVLKCIETLHGYNVRMAERDYALIATP